MFPGLRQVTRDLLEQGGGSERRLLLFALAHQTVRLSVVVTAIADLARARVSIVRLPGGALGGPRVGAGLPQVLRKLKREFTGD